ncbi:Biotin transporter BioY [Roseovarius litorisediminis]|uniref:Biotin transporter n=1 Tax=Roseovarius litorisediminis TaxID=1312363 RepID=A0A1Y5R9E1_9RHOB|nr:biotin transporter BioY [Roseovarius litorisediminis]SLN12229.1 Biotin transporter BioY [Roseovarius litorisediminis]
MRNTVLAKAVIGQETLLRKAGLVLGGSFFIALAAQVSVPFFPVPLTLQTLAILIVGLTFGSRLGAVTLLAYLAEGAMGLPVFANGMNGAALMGPTAGFLFGFVGMAYLAGLAVEKGLARGVVTTAVCGIAISALLYVPGLAWPAAVLGKSMPELWTYWMSPFLLGDAVKAVIAAMVVAGGWATMRARKG